MANLDGLTTDSRLSNLPLIVRQVSPDYSGEEVAQLFEADPSLPGILVMEAQQLVGLVSRRHFHEQISSPYGLEVFFNRPISAFLAVSQQKGLSAYLLMPASEKIEAAVREGLNRPLEAAYEPVIVFEDLEDGVPRYSLLDFQTLLLAQSKILALVNNRLTQQWQQNRHYMLKLDEERQRVKQYAALQKKQQLLVQDRNRVLERQQAELVQKNQQIARLNERFVKLSQLLSSEGHRTFEATFSGVEGICKNTAAIVSAGQQLGSEVRTVQQASDMVARVSYQVRHLATKAAIVANNGGEDLRGFSQIAEEISKLVNQTYQAGQQLDSVAKCFEDRVQNLTSAANSGTVIARSLTQNIARMQAAIAQLETIIQPLDPGLSESKQTSPAPVNPDIFNGQQSAAAGKNFNLVHPGFSYQPSFAGQAWPRG